ncbi:hypothetical protein ACJMK2_025127 [Sinanodonta woodiana]|uniref:Uncharacterized protein n=1 Tax=Sinanodonta woodiana TaxID=1069815 RepID=A0ABD3XJD3_SINWO
MAELRCCWSGTVGLLLSVLVLALSAAGTFNANWWEKGSGENMTVVHLFENVHCDEDGRCRLDKENTEVWIRLVQATSILCLALTVSSLISQICNMLTLKIIFATISGGFLILTGNHYAYATRFCLGRCLSESLYRILEPQKFVSR